MQDHVSLSGPRSEVGICLNKEPERSIIKKVAREQHTTHPVNTITNQDELKHAETVTSPWNQELIVAIGHLWQNYYFIGEKRDMAAYLAQLLHGSSKVVLLLQSGMLPVPAEHREPTLP